jgi:hypothetical protein
MTILPGVCFAFFGLFVGLLVWSRAVRWIHSIWVAVKARRSGNPADAPASSFLVLALLHSGPWLLATVIAFAWIILSRPHPAGWHWFFGGMLATPLLIAVNVAVFMRRVRRRRAQPTEP